MSTESVFDCVAFFLQAPADVQTDPRRACVTHAGQAHKVGRGGAAEIVWAGVHVRVQVSVNRFTMYHKPYPTLANPK